jgi:hypothetical protein
VRRRRHDDCASEEDLLQMYFEKEEISAGMREAADTLRALPNLRAYDNAANVGLLYHRESLLFDHAMHAAGLHAAEEMLLRRRVPFDVAYSERWDEAARFDLLIVPQARLLSDEEAGTLTAFVNGGGRLLVIGNTGLYDERYRLRKNLALCDLTGVTAFDRDERIHTQTTGKGATAHVTIPNVTETLVPHMFGQSTLTYPRWYERTGEVSDALCELLGDKRQLRLDGDGALGVSLFSKDGDACVIQVLSYEENPVHQPLTLEVSPDVLPADAVTWQTPAGRATVEPETADGGRRRLQLEGFEQFGAVVWGNG